MNTSNRIWLITGVSGGLGRALAKEAAMQGEIVYGTLRKPEQISALMNWYQAKPSESSWMLTITGR